MIPTSPSVYPVSRKSSIFMIAIAQPKNSLQFPHPPPRSYRASEPFLHLGGIQRRFPDLQPVLADVERDALGDLLGTFFGGGVEPVRGRSRGDDQGWVSIRLTDIALCAGRVVERDTLG